MEFKEYNIEAVSELLLYLSENQKFDSVNEVKGFTQDDVREILREIALSLKDKSTNETQEKRPQYESLELSAQAMALVSALSPREEMLLFKSFKII